MSTKTKTINCPLIPSARFSLTLFIFFGCVVQYTQRINLSIGIVCMINKTYINTELESIPYLARTDNQITKISSKNTGLFFQDKRFSWTESEQQMVLGAYWIGYIITLIPGGWLSIIIGAKRIYIYCLLISSIATLALSIIYLLDTMHFVFVFILRIIIGFAHGALIPATYSLWSVWAAPQERGTLTSLGFSGINFGTAIIMLTGGFCCRYIDSGWIYLFILSSLLGFLWIPWWSIYVADTPALHKTISENELNFLNHFNGQLMQDKQRQVISLISLPWKNIIRSKPIIALFITQLCNLFGLFFFSNTLGKLLQDIHHIPTLYIGYILCTGFILMQLSGLTTGITADYLVRKNFISLTNVRKLFNSLTSFSSALCIIILCFCDESRKILGAITVLIYLFSSGFALGSGFLVNFADIVPAYSGLIFGIANTFASLSGFLGNIMASFVIKQPILNDWRKLFIPFIIIYIIGGIVFLLYGSAEPLQWARFPQQNESNNDDDDDDDDDDEQSTCTEKLQPIEQSTIIEKI
ncbi:unnamed protein product [Rotaria sp. Silwood2]|nr:unnamed protein product [Rotaria sp. Silwood2]CAF3961590.1 unnamed protein product [Rotaria sp. Silwood2]